MSPVQFCEETEIRLYTEFLSTQTCSFHVLKLSTLVILKHVHYALRLLPAFLL